MRRPWFYCHATEMWEDNWTYGQWRQYVCNHPNGQTQCAKRSALGGLVVFIGFGLTMASLMSMAFKTVNNWPAAVAILVIALIMWIGPFIAELFGWRLMKAVGPHNIGSRRVLNHEVD